jgi:hypothetical protein
MTKINKLEIENTKRVKAVAIEPTANGLTIIGGDNGQGKTSVLDAIAWGLGGNKYKPSNAKREGSVTDPRLKITMDNGLIVERAGKNSTLKVIDPDGVKAGQKLLDSFVEELAIDLPKFMDQTPAEKAKTLLQVIGVGDQLYQLEVQEQDFYNQRHALGQIKDQKAKFAKELDFYPDAPKQLVSASELIQEQQALLSKNAENERLRQNLEQIKRNYSFILSDIASLEDQLAGLKKDKEEMKAQLETATKSALDLKDESTDELEENIANIDEINRQVRVNLDKNKAEEDAAELKDQYDMLSGQIEEVREAKTKLLNDADLPLPGLSVDAGVLVYNGQQWDNMSGSEQLRVATAIVRKLKPECGFVLLDKLEQMDMKTLNEFGAWLEQEGLQAIATRVSTGEECSIIIEDGYAVVNETPEETPKVLPKETPTWKEGEF